FAGWGQQPVDHLRDLWAGVAGGSFIRTVAWGGVLLAVITAMWNPIGGWIARHELMARRRADFETAEGPSATAFLFGWLKQLLITFVPVLVLILVALVPVIVAGWVNDWGSLGALLVAVLLPVLLVADLCVFLLAVGVVAWPLMPATVAAECSDALDALGRSYNYLYQRTISFLPLTALVGALAATPLGALYLGAETMSDWEPWLRQVVGFLAAGLSASIFWSLQPLVYLQLHTTVDGTDAGELAFGPPHRKVRETPPPAEQTASVPPTGNRGSAGGQGRVRKLATWLFGSVGSWCLTYWLLRQAS